MPGKNPKKPKTPILKRELTAKTMKYITRLTNKKYVKPLKRKYKSKGIQRSKKIGQYLLKRKFRSSPEEIFAVKELYSEKRFEEKAKNIVNYLMKEKTLKKQTAIKTAIDLLYSIEKKAEKKYLEAYRKTAIKTHGKGKEYKKYYSGQEHMFGIDRLYMGIELVIYEIKKI